MTESFRTCLPLRANRVHEVMGAAAVSFAAIVCGMTGRTALWVRDFYATEELNPVGLAAFLEPHNLILATGRGQAELLALCEEALRSGAVAVVVAELSNPVDLTAGRRLQLAAEVGGSTGLLILPEGMGSNAAETRWRCLPLFDEEDSTLQQWRITKNKSGTFGDWKVRWDDEARRIIVVAEIGERAGSAAPGAAGCL